MPPTSTYKVNETPLLPLITADLHKVEDGIVTSILGGKIEIESSANHAIASKEVLADKVHSKQMELEESLKVMLNDGTMSRIEYNNKLKQIRQGSKEIEDAILSGGAGMEELQISLGIINGRVIDVKQLSSIKNVPPPPRDKRALSVAKPLAL